MSGALLRRLARRAVTGRPRPSANAPLLSPQRCFCAAEAEAATPERAEPRWMQWQHKFGDQLAWVSKDGQLNLTPTSSTFFRRRFLDLCIERDQLIRHHLETAPADQLVSESTSIDELKVMFYLVRMIHGLRRGTVVGGGEDSGSSSSGRTVAGGGGGTDDSHANRGRFGASGGSSSSENNGSGAAGAASTSSPAGGSFAPCSPREHDIETPSPDNGGPVLEPNTEPMVRMVRTGYLIPFYDSRIGLHPLLVKTYTHACRVPKVYFQLDYARLKSVVPPKLMKQHDCADGASASTWPCSLAMRKHLQAWWRVSCLLANLWGRSCFFVRCVMSDGPSMSF
jgi:hypothetical protein